MFSIKLVSFLLAGSNVTLVPDEGSTGEKAALAATSVLLSETGAEDTASAGVVRVLAANEEIGESDPDKDVPVGAVVKVEACVVLFSGVVVP